jgi:hypothetical protein
MFKLNIFPRLSLDHDRIARGIERNGALEKSRFIVGGVRDSLRAFGRIWIPCLRKSEDRDDKRDASNCRAASQSRTHAGTGSDLGRQIQMRLGSAV